MSISNTIPERINSSYEAILVDPKRQARYELCLSFVKQVITDFISVENEFINRQFEQLGVLACNIDSYVDELSIDEKHLLQQHFPALFDDLMEVQSFNEFHHKCLEFRTITLQLEELNCSYHSMYAFFTKCMEYELMDELKAFASEIVQCSLDRYYAESVDELLQINRTEGKAAVEFVYSFALKTGVCELESERLKHYLFKLEQLVNLGDQLLDSYMDKKNGIIQLKLSPWFYVKIVGQLSKNLFLTWLNHPISFTKHFFVFSTSAVLLELK